LFRPWIFEASKTLVVLVEVSNLLLDYVLTCNLYAMGAYGYATLLGFVTSLSIVVSVWMKYIMYGLRKEIIQPESILVYVLITELFVFSFENVTTILVLTRVDEDGDALVKLNETFGADLNLWTTISSGMGVELLLIIFITMSLFEGRRDGQLSGLMCRIVPSIFAMFNISYFLYFAVDKVLLENPMKEFEDMNLKQAYIMNMVIVFVLLICSNIVVYYIAMHSGGN